MALARGSSSYSFNYKNNEWQKPLVIFMAEREGFEPSCAFAQTDFEKSGRCHNPSLCVPNFRKIRRFFRFSSAHLSDFSEK